MEELIDILDENGMKTGIVENREIVHKKGLIHSEVTAFIYTETGKILLQKRSNNKKIYSNCWSTTGGHVLSGETNKQALEREIKEEIGIIVNDRNIEYILTYKSDKTKNEIINNKFMSIYIVKIPNNINKFKIQYEELNEIKYFSIEEVEKALDSNDENYKFPQMAKEAINKIKQII